MIHCIMREEITSPEIVKESFQTFLHWVKDLDCYELDTETTVSDFWCDKKLITIQFGYKETQWLLQYSHLTDKEKAELKEVLENPATKKLIHNAQFEYIVLRFHGIEIANVYDTMVVEQIITCGLELQDYSLADLTCKYLGFDIDKTLQTSFGDDTLTVDKIIYAVTDVKHLAEIRYCQMVEVEKHELQATVDLENEVVLVLAEMTYHGVLIDVDYWLENTKYAQPIVDKQKQELNEWILKEPLLYNKALELGYISKTDSVLWNFNSPNQKQELLELLYPTLTGSSKPILKKFFKLNQHTMSPEEVDAFEDIVNELNYTAVGKLLLRDHREYLINRGYLIPANTLTINWNSRDQALPLLKAIHPRLQDLSEESISTTTHPIFESLTEYKDSLKLINTYGQKFIDKHLEPDGKIRTTYNQVVSTGRLSSRKPNMQNIPAKEHLEVRDKDGNLIAPYTRYRNAFICKKDWVFVDSDFVSAELVIAAYISNDPVWLEALEKGQDLHSVCAELVYKHKWSDGQEPNCAYYKRLENSTEIAKEKCKCKKHKTLRNSIKTINFGLIYGLSEFGLSRREKITLKEAKDLIDTYFLTFPKIKGVLKALYNFGVLNGYSQTPLPYKRKRFYPYWHFAKNNIKSHLAGIENNSILGSIGRASSNHPMQGGNADITKAALVLMYKWLREHNLQDVIHLVLQVHDQITTVCDDSVKEMWKEQMDKLMCDAGKIVVKNGLLKADTQITKMWTK